MASSSHQKRKEHIGVVETMSKYQKSAEPENLFEDVKVTQRMNVHVSPREEGVLIDWYNTLDEHSKSKFSSTYKNIMDMVKFPLDWNMIKAMLWFWSPYYRCFIFEDFDITPTVEEYTQYLGYDPKDHRKMYYPDIGVDPSSAFANLFEITTPEAKKFIKGDDDGDRKTINVQQLWRFSSRRCAEKRNNLYLIRGLALAIYSVVVFPTKQNEVHKSIIPLVNAITMHGINPASAILAETFSFFNHCRRNERSSATFFCASIFQTWAHNHILKDTKPKYRNDRPIYDAARSKRREWQLDKWGEFLDGLTCEEVVFFPIWSHCRREFLGPKGSMSCCVPLVGPRTCVSYTPSLVRRQFAARQIHPKKGFATAKDSSPPDFPDDVCACKVEFMWWGEEKKWEQLEKVKNKWEVQRLVEQEGYQYLFAKPDYLEWRRTRKMDFVKKVWSSSTTQSSNEQMD